ncbi:DNA mismatch endonuclease Vsr [soil metagenome]
MVDSISVQRRSWNMSRIKGRNTKPEMLVRSFLHCRGYRFRLHQKNLPGKPDIVLRKYKTVIFVNGCFWHRHENCADATFPKSKTEFWMNKFVQTVKRDERNREQLIALGWKVLIVWECEASNCRSILEIISNELVNEV